MVNVHPVNVVVNMDGVALLKSIVLLVANQNLVYVKEQVRPLPRLLFQLLLMVNVVHQPVNVHLVNVVVNMDGVVKPMIIVEPVVNLNLENVIKQTK